MPILPMLAEGALYIAGLISAASPFWQ